MFSNEEMRRIAQEQSAYDLGADVSDFCADKNKIVVSEDIPPKAKKYYRAPVSCHFVSYGKNLCASTRAAYYDVVKTYADKFTFYECFETPNIHWLDEALKPYGVQTCFMAEYWLCDMTRFRVLECPLPTKLLHKEDFAPLYRPEWMNALSRLSPENDVLGVGAYDGDTLVGFAACSADCDKMWQIGIDVLPDYRHRGIASALTSRLAQEILNRGRVPFYCCAWSNVASARNAVRSGFSPAWAEMTVKPKDIVNEIIEGE